MFHFFVRFDQVNRLGQRPFPKIMICNSHVLQLVGYKFAFVPSNIAYQPTQSRPLDTRRGNDLKIVLSTLHMKSAKTPRLTNKKGGLLWNLKNLRLGTGLRKKTSIAGSPPFRFIVRVTTKFVSPVRQFHQEIDRMFYNFLRGFNLPSMGFGRESAPLVQSEWLRPTLDIVASDKDYTISVELPGVDEKDVQLELSDDTLVIKGEKKHETEEKEKNYYWFRQLDLAHFDTFIWPTP